MNKLFYCMLFPLIAFGLCDKNSEKLVSSYSQIQSCKNNYIIWNDGTKMLYDDGKKKSFKELLTSPDIQDTFHFEYPINFFPPPSFMNDPGRIRNDAFFKKLYGNNKDEVKSKLKSIIWLPSGKNILVTSINDIDVKLSLISKELKNLPLQFQKYVVNIGGAFKWRNIAGTSRLSSHSLGSSIDINVKYSAYWRWSKGKYLYKNKIPQEIVSIFEKYGFIWGGKWFHYDTMHFEYRPELLK